MGGHCGNCWKRRMTRCHFQCLDVVAVMPLYIRSLSSWASSVMKTLLSLVTLKPCRLTTKNSLKDVQPRHLSGRLWWHDPQQEQQAHDEQREVQRRKAVEHEQV